MNFFLCLLTIILLLNCSFDDKSGIWKNANKSPGNNDKIFKDFKEISSSTDTYDRTKSLDKNFNFNFTNVINNNKWTDIFYNTKNNLENFEYRSLNQVRYLSKKITKKRINPFLLFKNENLISSDKKGNITIFSINEKKILHTFNFYKKRYKNIEIIINFIIKDNIIYVTDNIGYLYAYNYLDNKILWAKNYKIPFSSNLKIFNKKIIASNQNNDLYFFNINNGNILKFIPTEQTNVKNLFINNLSQNKENLFFLNTYGSLYGLDLIDMKINWFINLNQSIDINPANLFDGQQIINNDNYVIISANSNTYVIDPLTGTIIYKLNFSSIIKPILIDDYLFLVSKNNLLIAFSIKEGDVIYSYNINKKISEFLDIKKEKVKFKSMMLLNNSIFIFLKNSYVVEFSLEGNISNLYKIKNKFNSELIVIDKSLLYLDSKNRLNILD